VRCEALCNNSGIVVDLIDDFDRNLGNAVRIDVVGEKIADHPPSSCRREPVEKGSTAFWHATAMKPNIRSARLAPMRKRELMHIRTEISDTV